MTKTSKLTVLAFSVFFVPTLAMSASLADLDINGDGAVSVAEVQGLYPDATPEQFSAMDLNADGALDESEILAAQEAGMMPAPAPTE